MNHNTQIPRFLSMQVKKLKNVAFQIFQFRAIIGLSRTELFNVACFGSYFHVRILFVRDYVRFLWAAALPDMTVPQSINEGVLRAETSHRL